jgi:DNA polymerase/3'-5' exonuclease PolX
MTMATQTKTGRRSPRVKPTEKVHPMYALERAEVIADELVRVLSPACELIAIAGSIRRQAPQVHDIDIVIYPIIERVGQLSLLEVDSVLTMYPHLLFDVLAGNGWAALSFGRYPRIVRFEYRMMPVDLYIAEPDGSNYYSLLQCRTGSEIFNVNLVQRCRRLGLQYRAGHGIYKDGARFDDGTEAGIFRAVGMDYVQPWERD